MHPQQNQNNKTSQQFACVFCALKERFKYLCVTRTCFEVSVKGVTVTTTSPCFFVKMMECFIFVTHIPSKNETYTAVNSKTIYAVSLDYYCSSLTPILLSSLMTQFIRICSQSISSFIARLLLIRLVNY